VPSGWAGLRVPGWLAKTETRRRVDGLPRTESPTHPAEPAHRSHASAPSAVIHIVPHLHPPPLPTFLRRIHRTALPTSRLHITHTCTSGAHDHSCVTKRGTNKA
jgi:hypothetical protein